MTGQVEERDLTKFWWRLLFSARGMRRIHSSPHDLENKQLCTPSTRMGRFRRWGSSSQMRLLEGLWDRIPHQGQLDPVRKIKSPFAFPGDLVTNPKSQLKGSPAVGLNLPDTQSELQRELYLPPRSEDFKQSREGIPFKGWQGKVGEPSQGCRWVVVFWGRGSTPQDLDLVPKCHLLLLRRLSSSKAATSRAKRKTHKKHFFGGDNKTSQHNSVVQPSCSQAFHQMPQIFHISTALVGCFFPRKEKIPNENKKAF